MAFVLVHVHLWTFCFLAADDDDATPFRSYGNVHTYARRLSRPRPSVSLDTAHVCAVILSVPTAFASAQSLLSLQTASSKASASAVNEQQQDESSVHAVEKEDEPLAPPTARWLTPAAKKAPVLAKRGRGRPRKSRSDEHAPLEDIDEADHESERERSASGRKTAVAKRRNKTRGSSTAEKVTPPTINAKL